MRFFTSELWIKINSEVPLERDAANLQWDENAIEYKTHFELIEKRLPKGVIKVVKAESFHDFQLDRINVIQQKRSSMKYPVNVQLIITNGLVYWEIYYRKVSKFQINYSCENTEYAMRRGFDDWGYDEFLEVDDMTISHEILFASNSSILVHFSEKNISIRKSRIQNT